MNQNNTDSHSSSDTVRKLRDVIDQLKTKGVDATLTLPGPPTISGIPLSGVLASLAVTNKTTVEALATRETESGTLVFLSQEDMEADRNPLVKVAW